jgi:Dyp-type peroxidase family
VKSLPLADIQGLALRGYRLPCARYLLVEVLDGDAGRRLVGELSPQVTTGERWTRKPAATLNLAFTHAGLAALGLPRRSLESFPPEFAEGMRARAALLGDGGPSAPERWDAVWRDEPVHAWVAIHAASPQARDEAARRVTRLAEALGGPAALAVRWQDAELPVVAGRPALVEHFGFADGVGDVSFEGDGSADGTPGRGKLAAGGAWVPLATGEFLLGHRDEAGELPPAPVPHLLARNGTFLVHRKLHQNVATFRRYVERVGARYPGGAEKLAAKMVGRWRDGTPLVLSPHAPDPAIAADRRRLADFTYRDDADGARCPLGAHIRRVNPRDAQGFDGRLVNRHRLARRGLPYGEYVPEGAPVRDDDERGIHFVALAASLARQFEFVQQQWVQHGDGARQGNDRDPIAGSHAEGGNFMVQGVADPRDPPFLCAGLPSFVETRGGDYFFVPSITALRLIASGSVDPR